MSAARVGGWRDFLPTSTQQSAGLVGVSEARVGSGDVVLWATFTASGSTVPVQVPAGAIGVQSMRAFAHGAPSAATATVEGTTDDPTSSGAVWRALPTGNATAQPNDPSRTRYTAVRIRVTLTGGTTPDLAVTALIAA